MVLGFVNEFLDLVAEDFLVIVHVVELDREEVVILVLFLRFLDFCAQGLATVIHLIAFESELQDFLARCFLALFAKTVQQFERVFRNFFFFVVLKRSNLRSNIS